MKKFDDGHGENGRELDRRVLAAARREEPSPELRARMAATLGLSATAALAPTKTALGAQPSTPASPKAEAGSPQPAEELLGKPAGGAPTASGLTAGWLPWGAGLLGVAVVGTLLARGLSSKGPLVHMNEAPVETAAGAVASMLPSAQSPSQPNGETANDHERESTDATAPSKVSTSIPVITPPQFGSERISSSKSPADLSAEIALMDSARGAMAVGAHARALQTLRRYDSTYPKGNFRPEATALRVECLVRLGHTSEARVLGQRFVARHRGSPLADRVTRLIDDRRP